MTWFSDNSGLEWQVRNDNHRSGSVPFQSTSASTHLKKYLDVYIIITYKAKELNII